MSDGIRISTKGVDKLLRKMKNLPDFIKKDAHGVIGVAAHDMVDKATARVPTDTGRLRSSINYEEIKIMKWAVSTNVNYAPYVEFGTRSSVSVPAGLEQYAMQFKRSDGTGIGMPARPYFFNSFYEVLPPLKSNLREVLIRALKQ